MEVESVEPKPYRTLVDSLLDSIRSYQRYRRTSGLIALLMRKLVRIKFEVLTKITGADIGIEAKLGHNLKLPHPVGVVIHRDTVIGDDCMVMQQVTIGSLAEHGVPKIGSRVYIGAGAKVLGAIVIGDDARVGANAVVLVDVPPGATAVGIPAKIIQPSN